MEDLIKSLQILNKYSNGKQLVQCCDNAIYVQINPDDVSKQDIEELVELGFIVDKEGYENHYFRSYKLGTRCGN